MLSDHVPDDNHGSDVQYVRDVHLQSHEDAIVHRGRLSQLGGHYYRIRDLLDNERNILAGTTIADEIDWHSLPEDHDYHRSPDGSNHSSDIRPLIRWYSRKRGILLHHNCLRDGKDLAGLAEDLVSTPPEDHSHHDVQAAVAEWRHAPRVPHPDEDAAFSDAKDALAHRMAHEVDAARHNWERLNDTLDTRWVADETKVIGETPDGHAFGGEIDRLTEIRDGPVPPEVYVFDIKLADEWHPRHLVQTEAYRRALSDDMPGINAAVARLGIEDRDYELIPTSDDGWDADELWNLFSRRADSLYDGKHSVSLRISGH